MPLVATSTPADLATLLRTDGADPATGMGAGVGDTTSPTDPRMPLFHISVQRTGDPGKRQYRARLYVDEPAEPGDDASVYLTTGIYETNRSIDVESYREYVAEDPANADQAVLCERPFDGSNRVYWVMPAAVAQLNKLAEEEHCADFRLAYDRTVGALQAALAGVQGRAFGPAADRAGAYRLVEQAVAAALPAAVRTIGIGLFGAWQAELTRLGGLSRTRDDNGWHTFGSRVLPAAPAGAVTYLTGALRDPAALPRVYVELTPGGTQIGRHTPAAVLG